MGKLSMAETRQTGPRYILGTLRRFTTIVAVAVVAIVIVRPGY
jgi:hypothetical protein